MVVIINRMFLACSLVLGFAALLSLGELLTR